MPKDSCHEHNPCRLFRTGVAPFDGRPAAYALARAGLGGDALAGLALDSRPADRGPLRRGLCRTARHSGLWTDDVVYYGPRSTALWCRRLACTGKPHNCDYGCTSRGNSRPGTCSAARADAERRGRRVPTRSVGTRQRHTRPGAGMADGSVAVGRGVDRRADGMEHIAAAADCPRAGGRRPSHWTMGRRAMPFVPCAALATDCRIGRGFRAGRFRRCTAGAGAAGVDADRLASRDGTCGIGPRIGPSSPPRLLVQPDADGLRGSIVFQPGRVVDQPADTHRARGELRCPGGPGVGPSGGVGRGAFRLGRSGGGSTRRRRCVFGVEAWRAGVVA